MTLEMKLNPAEKNLARTQARDNRGTAKKGRPPEITVKATAIGNGKMEITFEYYPEGKCKQVTYTGTLDEIEAQARNLPLPVQDFARVALNRLRNRRY
jgi:hypothetical protein